MSRYNIDEFPKDTKSIKCCNKKYNKFILNNYCHHIITSHFNVINNFVSLRSKAKSIETPEKNHF